MIPRRRTLAIMVAATIVGGGAALAVTRPTVPSFDAVRSAHRPSDVPLLDRHGAVVHELRTDRGERRLAWIPLAEVAPALTRAVIAAEDRRFRDHGGVDWWALGGAAGERARRAVSTSGGRAPRGASTITMQLAALLDPSLGRHGGRTLRQKARQMRAARAYERAWSKDQILEAYLNRVGFRGELRGVGAVAAFVFGKLPHGLSEPEAFVLAALLQSPNAPAAAVAGRAARLAERAGATLDDAAVTLAARRLDDPARRIDRPDAAAHLARRVLAGRAVAVVSTLDADVQRTARGSLARALAALHDRHVEDGAVLVADNASGDVLAYVGGSGARSRARYVDIVRARRQPGSTLKPFLYGLAFERRLLTPASLVADEPLALAVTGGLYRPRDYDTRFRGLVSARTALAASLNVPAVRTLELVGGDAFVETLRGLGFAAVTENADFYGPALALGGTDVTLEELVTAYRAIATGGLWSPLRFTRDDPRPAPRRVLAPETAFLLTDVLTDREARSTTFGLESALATPFFSAVKTGTSQEMRDNWCVGFSERYTVGVWVGNASGAPMHDVSGVAGAAPVWLEVMSALHARVPSAPPAAPPGVTAAPVTFPDAREPARHEWFVAGTEPGARALAAGDPRIVTPVGGTIVALDPDIPRTHQRLALEAAGAAPGLRWHLDGVDLGPVDGLMLWEPRAGAHRVALVDADRRERDATTFEVRGGAR